MDLYYNPERMPASEIKDTFVARQWLVDELLSTLKRQPKDAGVQHAIIVGPRGMGKTTILLILKSAIAESELGTPWTPVRFPEESYAINDLADFWLTTMAHLAFESSDSTLVASAESIKREFADSGALCDAAVACLKDWCHARKRRLVLLIDNLDMVLDQINDAAENARLRDVLMNDGTFMLIGTATSFFKEARRYDQPLYNFFRTYNLESLNSDEVNDLLRRRAAVDQRTDFDELMRRNQGRIGVLHYFTGGNPRLVLMLYRIIASSDFLDVRRGLEKLLDEVTPYYKAKVESLPPQQRKILDQVARVSGHTHEGLTPTQIAQETRLPVNQVSTQLRRLYVLGYVRAANIRARNSYYSLAEPLYAIWYQMRFGRESRQRMEWLVEFLKGWYTNREIHEQSEWLAGRFRELLEKGQINAAAAALEFRRYLSSALEPYSRVASIERLVSDCLDAGEIEQAREILVENQQLILIFGIETLKRLGDNSLIDGNQPIKLIECRNELKSVKRSVECADWVHAIILLRGLKSLFHSLPELWFVYAQVLTLAGQGREALRELHEALSFMHDDGAEHQRALLLAQFNDFEGAIDSCNRISREYAKYPTVQFIRAVALAAIGEYDEAISSAEQIAAHNAVLTTQITEFIRQLKESSWATPELVFIHLTWRGLVDRARLEWQKLTDNNSPRLVVALKVSMRPDNLEFLRSLIQESNLSDMLFPMARSLDYLITRDRKLLESLSSEVRPIVDEIVAEYEKQQTVDNRQLPSTRLKTEKRRKPASP